MCTFLHLVVLYEPLALICLTRVRPSSGKVLIVTPSGPLVQLCEVSIGELYSTDVTKVRCMVQPDCNTVICEIAGVSIDEIATLSLVPTLAHQSVLVSPAEFLTRSDSEVCIFS